MCISEKFIFIIFFFPSSGRFNKWTLQRAPLSHTQSIFEMGFVLILVTTLLDDVMS